MTDTRPESAGTCSIRFTRIYPETRVIEAKKIDSNYGLDELSVRRSSRNIDSNSKYCRQYRTIVKTVSAIL